VLKKKSFYTEVHFLVLYHSDFKIIRVSGPINYSEYDDSDDDDPPTFIAIINLGREYKLPGTVCQCNRVVNL
jgi:hypothetical protein